MLDLQAIEAQLAKGDPALKDVYLKLKARLVPNDAFSAKADFKRTQVLVDKIAPLKEPKSDFSQYTTPDMVDEELIADTVLASVENRCSKCSRVCASKLGLSSHERKCKA